MDVLTPILFKCCLCFSLVPSSNFIGYHLTSRRTYTLNFGELFGENSVRRKMSTAKIPFGQISVRRNFRQAKIPFGENSFGENSQRRQKQVGREQEGLNERTCVHGSTVTDWLNDLFMFYLTHEFALASVRWESQDKILFAKIIFNHFIA